MEHEKYAVGYKNVTINDPFFPGHFPQRAIMPGKLQSDSLTVKHPRMLLDEMCVYKQAELCFW